MEKLITLPRTTSNIGEMLCTSLAKSQANSRHCLLKILSSLRYLARQGCAIRRAKEDDGNLQQLMKLMSQDDLQVIMVITVII